MSEMPMSILLVDDDPHACAVFEIVMKHHHYPLTIFNDGESALSYLQSHSPDIVVLDIFLPDLDGYQVLDHIRQSAMMPNCPVVATTAYHTNDTQQEVLSRGFNGYVEKPFTAQMLVPYLQSVLGQG